MPTNVEIKARIKDFDKLRRLVEELSDTPCEMLLQEDTFFHTPKGRLKLRAFAPNHRELIYYERHNPYGPKRSHYLVSAIPDPNSLKAVLSAVLSIRGVVHKQRHLYHVRNTRIHLDKVEGLGSFLELEVMIRPDERIEQGKVTASELMAKLGIGKADLVDVSYIDLIESQSPNRVSPYHAPEQ